MIAKSLIGSGWKVHVVFAFDGPSVKMMQKAGCITKVIPHKNWLRTSSLFQFIRKIIQEKKQSQEFQTYFSMVKPHCVYINSIVSWAAAHAAHKLNYPVVWHIRELFQDVGGEMIPPRILGKRFVQKTIQSKANSIVSISNAVASNVLGCLPKNLTIIANAVEPNFFSEKDPSICRTELRLPQNKTIIGIPGTLRPMKGHEFFIHSVKEQSKSVKELYFAVTGDTNSPFGESLLGQVKKFGLEKQFQFLGTVYQMEKFYKACQIVCVPSLAEPFGRVVIESFASKRPVVATAVGGIPEIIEHKKTGLLVPYGDSKQLIKSLRFLADHTPAAKQIANRAYEKAKEDYTVSTQSRRIEKVIENARSAASFSG